MRGIRAAIALGIAVALTASVVTAWASGTMQKAPSGQMQQKAPAQTEKKIQTAPPIKVEAQNLTVTPAQPQSGQQVTVKLTVKNTGTGTVAKVPWSIHLATGNQTLAQGEQTNVGPGASFEVTAQWTASAGDKLLQGYVDPTGKAFKNTAPVAAQIKELTVNVVQAAASTPVSVETEEKVLDHLQTKLNGANFASGAQGPTTCVVYTNGGRSGDTCSLCRSDAVLVSLYCKDQIVGGRANYDLYSNFSLKNGWQIVRTEVLDLVREAGDFRWDSGPPAVSSNNPSMKVHLWSNSGGRVQLNLKVTIKGPRGTNPYQ